MQKTICLEVLENLFIKIQIASRNFSSFHHADFCTFKMNGIYLDKNF